MGEKKTKMMLYSTLVEVEVGVELGNIWFSARHYPRILFYVAHFLFVIRLFFLFLWVTLHEISLSSGP